MYRLIVIALCTGISAAQAQISSRMEFGCSEPVAVCTQMRVKQLLLQSRQLAGAAALKPPVGLSVHDRKAIEAYDAWLRTQSAKASNLARVGQNARDQKAKMSFNLQYLQLQSQMQNENRRFTSISNIIKTKHDTTKNSISNVR
jgi:hypothetical protein